MTTKLFLANNTTEILQILKHLRPEGVLICDIDDTIITPVSNVFRIHSKMRYMLEEIKLNQKYIQDFEEILGNWRLQRKVMLISECWPEVINTLKVQYLVYALTKTQTGQFGPISSMEDWRHKELLQFGITFSKFIYTNTKINQYHGIFTTGNQTKGAILRQITSTLKPPQVIMIDDRLDHIEEAAVEIMEHEKIEKYTVPFIGIIFTGASHILGKLNYKVALLQKQHLLMYKEWLEDEEAEARLTNSAFNDSLHPDNF